MWRDHSRVLTASRGADGKLVAAFGDREAKVALPPELKALRDQTKTLCDQYFDGDVEKPVLNCDLMNGFIKHFEVGTPGAMSLARPLPPPVCGDDEALAGAFPICSKLCDAKRPCADKRAQCAPWMGAHVCRIPASAAASVPAP